jgi:hypothetical protein
MAVPVLTWIAMKWDEIVIALKGKRLAVLGARGVGKTHIIQFLHTGSIPAEYKQTVAPDPVSARRFQLKDLDLKIKAILDLSGDKAAYADWKEQAGQAHVIFYLLRADHLIARNAAVEARVSEDLRHIGEWLRARPSKPRLYIIGTHCDLDSNFAAAVLANRQGDYMDNFRALPIVKDLVAHGGGTHLVKVVLGSMKSIPETELLAYQIFKQVLS